MLRLEVLDHEGPTTWRWRLTDAGAFVADHPAELDPTEWQFEAFADLHRYLRWHAAPDRRLAHEAEPASQVGDWITARVLGPVAPALAAWAFASALQRVRAGERDIPTDDLSPVHAAIVRYAVDVLDGPAEVEPDAWMELVDSADDQGGEG